MFQGLRTKKTPTFGSSLKDVIQSGIENLDSGIGLYAPDAEAYSVFAPLFDPVIEEYHGGFKSTDVHPSCDFGDPSVFDDLDPEVICFHRIFYSTSTYRVSMLFPHV